VLGGKAFRNVMLQKQTMDRELFRKDAFREEVFG